MINVPVTINADDLLLLAGTLTGEYLQVHDAFNLTDRQVADLAIVGPQEVQAEEHIYPQFLKKGQWLTGKLLRPDHQGLRIRTLSRGPSHGLRPHASSFPLAIAFHWLCRSHTTMRNATGSAEM